ncbi:MAG TPA: helix-turn-helix domain-containing protein [Acidimicrobiales bacterium]|nr:helix-turn-helix domain-containing protein [Acidimicrobiales bacterium]
MGADRGTALGVDDLPRLLNINEVADVLGVNVRHVRRLVFENRIPYLKWGRLVRFDPRDIERWLRVSCERHGRGSGPPASLVVRAGQAIPTY